MEVRFRSNTNTMPNFRVPIASATHDYENCKRHCVSTPGALRRLCRIASRAGKQTTGYFADYTTKRQPVGKYELQQSTKSLSLLQESISKDTAFVQRLKINNRILSDLYGRGTLRTAPEEFNLAVNCNDLDVRNAEFICSYRIQSLPEVRLPMTQHAFIHRSRCYPL